MDLEQTLRGSFTTEKSKAYREALRKFKKNRLLRWKKKKKKKINEDKRIGKLKTAKDIYAAGKYWKHFNYKEGLDALIQKDKSGQYIYWAGGRWEQFDYEKGLEALKNMRFWDYYDKALENWPKNIKQSQAHIKRLAKTAKKLPMKKLKLKEK